MKRITFILAVLFSLCLGTAAEDLESMSWGKVCRGEMDAEWYGGAESQRLADIVLAVQKTNGGWMKNYELHKLTDSKLEALIADRNGRSCFDNYSTTQEMRFLAKVYQGCKVEKYREAFKRALDLIFTAEKDCGGWSQYWPLTGNGSYQDYITFNDDLMTNMLRLLDDIASNSGDFKDMVDENARARCRKSYDKALEMVVKCQVDDNGTKAAWCAQHDPADLLPAVGRPRELPSISCSESARLLSYLMTIENPSDELKETIRTAVAWLDAHKIKDKALETFTNTNGKKDSRIIDKPGTAIWGRFLQMGGESGNKVYDKFFTMLKNRGKSRSYTYQGKTHTYTEYEMATSSYREDMAYQPIFTIYTDSLSHLFYRFLYNYEDSDPVVDAKGVPITTSLSSTNRVSYQYMGDWCEEVINVEYPAWNQKMKAIEAADGATIYELSTNTYNSADGETYNFSNGISMSNDKGKKYAKGETNTVKYSAGVTYTITLPEGMALQKISFYGYGNQESDAYISSLNGKTYSPTDYVFPAKVGEQPTFVSHLIDTSANPATGSVSFTLGKKQCCLIITLYCY